MDDFLQKLKKVVRIVLYGLAISKSDCRKAGPYQLPLMIIIIISYLQGRLFHDPNVQEFIKSFPFGLVTIISHF